jgi:hypothetical protein
MVRGHLTRWLGAPIVNGRLALLCGVVAVALPTAIRAAVNGSVTGCEFTPYLPFVFLAAIVIGWWQAGLVALASVAILGGLFMGAPGEFLRDACAQSAAGVFLASSAVIIAVVTLIRQVIVDLQQRRADPPGSGIIFSLEKGEVWASWHGSSPPMRLGSQERVESMMEDFLAQGELGKRLIGKSE